MRPALGFVRLNCRRSPRNESCRRDRRGVHRPARRYRWPRLGPGLPGIGLRIRLGWAWRYAGGREHERRKSQDEGTELFLHDNSSSNRTPAYPWFGEEYTAGSAWIETARLLKESFRFAAGNAGCSGATWITRSSRRH